MIEYIKSIAIKILFFAMFSFYALGRFYPTFEGQSGYNVAITRYIAFWSITLIILTEMLRYLHNYFVNRKLDLYILFSFITILFISLISFVNTAIQYIDNLTDFTDLYPYRMPADSFEEQYVIVTSDSLNYNLKDEILKDYFNEPLLWIENNGGLSRRSEAFDATSLRSNEELIFKNFSRSVLFTLLVFSAFMEIIAYSKYLRKASAATSKLADRADPSRISTPDSPTVNENNWATALHRSRKLVAGNRVKEALELLLEICPKNTYFQNQLISLQSQLKAAEDQFSYSLAEDQKITTSKNRIQKAVLDLVDEIETEFKEIK